MFYSISMLFLCLNPSAGWQVDGSKDKQLSMENYADTINSYAKAIDPNPDDMKIRLDLA